MSGRTPCSQRQTVTGSHRKEASKEKNEELFVQYTL